MNECDYAGLESIKTDFFGLHGRLSAAYFPDCDIVHPVLLSTLNPLHISSFSALFFTHSSLFSPDSISSLSSLRIPSSLPSRFLSRSNSVHLCVHTPGCCSNDWRPHKRVDEQKTCRPPSTEMERGRRRDGKSNFICISIFLGEGLVCVCERKEELVAEGGF